MAIKGDTGVVRTNVATIRQEQDLARHNKILEWLSPYNYPLQQSDLIRRRQEGTGLWFLETTRFQTWMKEPKSSLFCKGMPGAGKTMTASIVINHLSKQVQSTSVGVAYVFCDYKLGQDQTDINMIGALVKQLVADRRSLPESLERIYLEHAPTGTFPDREQISTVLEEAIAQHATVHIVVDALDEWDDINGDRSRFLKELKNLQTAQDLRLMATSRFITEIEEAFQDSPTMEIRAEEEDVRRYVAGQMDRMPRCIRVDHELQLKIQDVIVSNVEGM